MDKIKTAFTGLPGVYNPNKCHATVSISASDNPFCVGFPITFTPTFAECFNQALIQSYQWYRDGVAISNDAILTTSVLANGSKIQLVVTLTTGFILVSNRITMVETNEGCITPVKYGLQYNYWAAIDSRYITNTGWVIPTVAQVNTLLNYIGGSSVAGGKLKEIGLTYWNSPNLGATNEVGFNARGSGWRSHTNGTFDRFKTHCHLITNSGNGSTYSVLLLATHLIYTAMPPAYYYGSGAIRLLKSSTILTNGQSGTYTGNDGKIYRTICIGNQEWLADNLAETKFRDGSTIPFAGANGINFTNAEWAALTTAACCPYNNDWDNV